MANAKYIGLIKCGLCGNENATVHEQQTGTKKGRKYYRCYSEINGSQMLCGTIQCIGQAGQDYITANIRPIGQPEPVVEPPRPIAPPAPPEPAPTQAPVPIAPPVEPEPPEPVPEEMPIPQELPIADAPPAPPAKRSIWEILTTNS